jgi:signal recognition particle subunit SEC65
MFIHPFRIYIIRLPFYQENSTALGVLAKHVLEQPVDNLAQVYKDLGTKFPSCKNPQADFEKGLKFWDQSVQAVSVLAKAVPKYQPILQQFEDADKFLSSRRKYLSK